MDSLGSLQTSPEPSVSEAGSPILRKNTMRSFVSIEDAPSDTLDSGAEVSPLPRHSCLSLGQRAKLSQFISSRKLPQFFQESNEQKQKQVQFQKQRVEEYSKIKAQMGLAGDPDELVEGLSDFLREVGFNTSFLDDEYKLRGEQVPLWQLLTRTLLNPLSIENRMFLENILPVKEEAIRWKNEKLEKEKRLKKMQERGEDKMSQSSRLGMRSQHKKREESPGIKGYHIHPKIQQTKTKEYQKNANKILSKVKNFAAVHFEDDQSPQKKNLLLRKHSKSNQGSPKKPGIVQNNSNLGQQLLIKKAILADMKKQRQKMKYQLEHHAHQFTDKQKIFEEEKIISYDQKMKLKQYEIELMEYMHKDDFKKCALFIISAQKANQKVGLEIMQGKKELPGVSPISLMIRGLNQELQQRQYHKNFYHLTQTTTSLPQINLHGIPENQTKVITPKQWRNVSKGKQFDSASLLDSSQADTNLTDNLTQLRKIRKQRKDIYDKERPNIFKLLDKTHHTTRYSNELNSFQTPGDFESNNSYTGFGEFKNREAKTSMQILGGSGSYGQLKKSGSKNDDYLFTDFKKQFFGNPKHCQSIDNMIHVQNTNVRNTPALENLFPQLDKFDVKKVYRNKIFAQKPLQSRNAPDLCSKSHDIKPVLKPRPFRRFAESGNSSPDARHYMCQSNRLPNLDAQLPKVPWKMRESSIVQAYKKDMQNIANMHIHQSQKDLEVKN